MEMEICRWKHRTKKKIDDLQTINGSQNWNHMNLEAISITTQNISHEIVNNVKNYRKKYNARYAKKRSKFRLVD